MITCALTPSTLARNASWNPVVTASTIVSAATPSATPSTDTLVNTENTDNRPKTAVEIMPSTSVSTPYGLEPPEVSTQIRPAAVTASEPAAHDSISGSRLPPYR